MDNVQEEYEPFKKRSVSSKVYKGRQHGGTRRAEAIAPKKTRLRVYALKDATVMTVEIGNESFYVGGVAPFEFGYSINKNKRWELVGDRLPSKVRERKAKREAIEEDRNLATHEYAPEIVSPAVQDFRDERFGISASVMRNESGQYDAADAFKAYGTPLSLRSRWEEEGDELDIEYRRQGFRPPKDKLKGPYRSHDRKRGKAVIMSRKGPRIVNIRAKKSGKVDDLPPKEQVDYGFTVLSEVLLDHHRDSCTCYLCKWRRHRVAHPARVHKREPDDFVLEKRK